MKRIFLIIMVVVTVALIAAATASKSTGPSTSSPQGAADAFYGKVKAHDVAGAYAMVSPSTNTSREDFQSAVFGSDGSLKTLSQLQTIETRTLEENGDQAMVRANLTWSTAVGALHESKDLKFVKDNNTWTVVYPVAQEPNLPPQVVVENGLRWDIIHGSGGAADDWGAQGVESPHVRITSMNGAEYNGGTVIMGEVVNEDTVPAYVSVNAVLSSQDGKELGQEASFDKIQHVLLPKEVTPFRIDFPAIPYSVAKTSKVNMTPVALLVPASADPVIAITHQQIKKDNAGRSVLSGELVNESGSTVNIPQVLATYYDNGGRVIWVSDSYVDKALAPQTPEPFSAPINEQVAPNVHTYRVSVNHYSINQGGAE